MAGGCHFFLGRGKSFLLNGEKNSAKRFPRPLFFRAPMRERIASKFSPFIFVSEKRAALNDKASRE